MIPAPPAEIIRPMHMAANTVHTPSRDAYVEPLDRVMASAAIHRTWVSGLPVGTRLFQMSLAYSVNDEGT